MPNGHSTLSLLSRPGLIPTRHSRPTQWTSLPLSAACPIHAAAEQKVGNLEDSALGLIPGQPHTASGLRWGVRPQSPFRFPISTFTAHPVRLLAPPCGPGLDGLLSGTAGGRSNVSASCLACPIHAGAVFKIVTRFLEAGRRPLHWALLLPASKNLVRDAAPDARHPALKNDRRRKATPQHWISISSPSRRPRSPLIV